MAQIEEIVGRYLRQLDGADRQEPSEAIEIKNRPFPHDLKRRSTGANDDSENEHDGVEPGEVDEYEQGATACTNQTHGWTNHSKDWSVPDNEPSLGWTVPGRGNPETALRGYDHGREENIGADEREGTTDPNDEECDDSGHGIVDFDGFHEQALGRYATRVE